MTVRPHLLYTSKWRPRDKRHEQKLFLVLLLKIVLLLLVFTFLNLNLDSEIVKNPNSSDSCKILLRNFLVHITLHLFILLIFDFLISDYFFLEFSPGTWIRKETAIPFTRALTAYIVLFDNWEEEAKTDREGRDSEGSCSARVDAKRIETGREMIPRKPIERLRSLRLFFFHSSKIIGKSFL